MEEEDNIIVKWTHEDVETSYNLLNNNNNIKIKMKWMQLYGLDSANSELPVVL